MLLTIDDKTCLAHPGEFLLEVARREGISIPTLCHHSALPGQACCRLCVVELLDSHGNTKTVTACVYPAAEGLVVRTNTPKIRQFRHTLLTILLERAPKAQGLAELCAQYGVQGLGQRFSADPEEKCILCGLCVKACALMGTSSLAAANRGVEKKVMTLLDQNSPTCIGCGACGSVCPTGAIHVQESPKTRKIWGKTFDMIPCPHCGKPWATREQMDWLASRGLENPDLCHTCRRKAAVQSYGALPQTPQTFKKV